MNLILGIVAALVIIASPTAALTAQTPVALACETTRPTDIRPDDRVSPFSQSESVYFEDGIWVSIPADGVLELAADQTIAFGTLQGWRTETFTWLRDEGVEGFVLVSGERLDEESTLSPQTPLSPQRQYVQVGYVKTAIAFPSAGCWEVTGTVGPHAITWVMDVRFVSEPAATPAEPCPNGRLSG